MSRKSRSEYIADRRRAYQCAGAARRVRILDEACETPGYSRKYVNKLLTGSVRNWERKGRGKSSRDDVRPVLAAIWNEAGCPCAPYFKAEIGRSRADAGEGACRPNRPRAPQTLPCLRLKPALLA